MKFITRILSHTFVSFFILVMLLPIYLAVVAASHEGNAMMHAPLPALPGGLLLKNMSAVLTEGLSVTGGGASNFYVA